MNDESDFEDNSVNVLLWQQQDDDDQVVPDFGHMTMNDFGNDHMLLHHNTNEMSPHAAAADRPVSQRHHISQDSGYQGSPNVAVRAGATSPIESGEEDVFEALHVSDETSMTFSIGACDGYNASEIDDRRDTVQSVEDIGLHALHGAKNSPHQLSHSAMDSCHQNSNAPPVNSSPLRHRASEPVLVTSSGAFAGARPKTSNHHNNSEGIPFGQSQHTGEFHSLGQFLSPNTRAHMFNYAGQIYGTPPRAYGFSGVEQAAGSSFFSQVRRLGALGSVTNDLRQSVEESVRHTQEQFNQGQERLQPEDAARVDENESRRRYHSVVTPPDLSQLEQAQDNDTEAPPNGLVRARQRSHSAPAVMTLERAFGRELRRISDEFDKEHQVTSSRRTRNRATARHGSALSYQQQRRTNHRLSFPGAEGQEMGWWQHIVQWIPIPGYAAGSPITRHRTEPLNMCERVSEEEEEESSDEVDALPHDKDQDQDNSGSGQSEHSDVLFTLDEQGLH